MNKRLTGYLVLGLVILALMPVMYFLGNKDAVQNMIIVRVTPDALASAMANDNFYSTYRQSALLVSGKVASVTTSGQTTLVGYQTSVSYHATCVMDGAASQVKVGDTVTLLTMGGTAERQPAGVLLHGCVQP